MVKAQWWLLVAGLSMFGCTTAARVAPAATASRGKATPELYDAIVRADRELFDAFNAHDAAALQRFFAPDLEFFQDGDGLQHYDEVERAFRDMFANNNGLRRDLVGPIQVYPVPRYGAIEIGSHRFCHPENGRDDCGTYGFVHVWKNDGGTWRLARVISYGH